jgi:hypothetical protein
MWPFKKRTDYSAFEREINARHGAAALHKAALRERDVDTTASTTATDPAPAADIPLLVNLCGPAGRVVPSDLVGL